MRQYYFDINGDQIPNIEAMIAFLLDEDYLFANSRQYVCPFRSEFKEETLVLFLNVNDLFCPAADALGITLNEVPSLFDYIQKYPKIGADLWACKKTNMQPWSYCVKNMKERGTWCEEFEKLPVNSI